MKFGKTLSTCTYEPWKDQYIDYSKLKLLLRENRASEPREDSAWTDDDEAHFAEELLNVQLEKVKTFQAKKYEDIKIQTGRCERQLESLHLGSVTSDKHKPHNISEGEDATLREVLHQLDTISDEVNQLERFSRINFSGFRKIVKKHDKRRGLQYKLRALLSSRLAELPLNTEDYSPLLYRLSAMYSFIRHHLQDEHVGQSSVPLNPKADEEEYDSMTFFVHPDDLVEVKTFILRHLPVLVYNPNPSSAAKGPHNDPRLTSIYFDNLAFSLYAKRLGRQSGASSLRLRWFGQVDENAELTLEKKTLAGQEMSREQRVRLKKKYVSSFLQGEYSMEKKIAKMRARGNERDDEASKLELKVEEIQAFVAENALQPLVRSIYSRTAFQVPGDDSIRILIDTDLKFARETQVTDTFRGSQQESFRNLNQDNYIDEEFPSMKMKGASISDFPWAVLTVKLRDDVIKKGPTWISDLTSSHLLREAPKFSKFVHGVASLYEDIVTELPFWINLLDADIRRDPQAAFEEEQSREVRLLEETQAVGSYGGTPRRQSSLHPFAIQSKSSLSPLQGEVVPSFNISSMGRHLDSSAETQHITEQHSGLGSSRDQSRWFPGIREVLPTLSSSRYAKARRQRQELPPGVEEPRTWLKDLGPVKVEPKVWLANQRTFIKWQHISILLASLSLALYNSAGRYNTVARALAIVYTLIAVLIALWGWMMYILRSHIIRERSGKDLDNVLGPTVVCISLGIALCVNLGLHLQG